MLKAFIKATFTRSYIRYLHLVIGLLSTFILLEWQHERNLYQNIITANDHNFNPNSDTAEVRTLMLTISSLMFSRSSLFQDHQRYSLKQQIFQSSDIGLMYGSGACGGFSKVLARTLQLKGYKVRIAQLKTLSYGYGGHTIVEFYSKSCKSWVFIDPIFQVYFIKANGKWAGINDLIENWNGYKSQMPEKFKQQYRFNGVRYTNWNKLGFLSRGIKAMLNVITSEKFANTLCLRMYFLATYPIYIFGSLSIYVLLMLNEWRLFSKKQKKHGESA